MSSMEGLYKKKAPGFGNREVRTKLKEQKSKSKREELLASKRRIPLSVLQGKDDSILREFIEDFLLRSPC